MPKEQDADFYSSLGENYETAFGHDTGLVDFTKKAISYLPAQAHVLDVGCGTGKPVATLLHETGHYVTGIDISDVMIELSQKAVPTGRFKLADMRTYTPDQPLNAVFNMLSLFALSRDDIEAMVPRWSQWLQVDGIVTVGSIAAEDCHPETKGNGYDADGLGARKIPFRFMATDITLDLLTRKGWEKILTEHGFVILETMTDTFAPPPEAGCDEEAHYFIVAKKIW